MDLYQFDDLYRVDGVQSIAGIDEAGRGPIAGPVVAAAVIMPPDVRVEGVRDSKKVPEKQRAYLFEQIVLYAAEIGVGISDVESIERYNILGATKLAMESAVRQLCGVLDLLLIDAVELPNIGVRQESMFKGDAKSASIAAASIVAKVVRDAIMLKYHGQYPDYGFHKHKGYGTREHLEALRRHGPCPVHRKDFRGVMTQKLPF